MCWEGCTLPDTAASPGKTFHSRKGLASAGYPCDKGACVSVLSCACLIPLQTPVLPAAAVAVGPLCQACSSSMSEQASERDGHSRMDWRFLMAGTGWHSFVTFFVGRLSCRFEIWAVTCSPSGVVDPPACMPSTCTGTRLQETEVPSRINRNTGALWSVFQAVHRLQNFTAGNMPRIAGEHAWRGDRLATVLGK